MKRKVIVEIETDDHMHAGCSGCQLWLHIAPESCVLHWDDGGKPGPECRAAEIEVDEILKVLGEVMDYCIEKNIYDDIYNNVRVCRLNNMTADQLKE